MPFTFLSLVTKRHTKTTYKRFGDSLDFFWCCFLKALQHFHFHYLRVCIIIHVTDADRVNVEFCYFSELVSK